MEEVNVKFATGRLESLINATILENCSSINFDSAYGLYDSMISLFSAGRFDSIFNSPAFTDLNTDERRNLLKSGRKYLNLCFGNGGVGNWADYAAKHYSGDFDLFFMQLLDNFDLLLTVLRYGKEDSMDFLSELDSIKGNFDESIFDKLRLSFPNKSTLIQSLIMLGQKSNMFSEYPIAYKKSLCENPNGVLFTSDGENIDIKSPFSVSFDIYSSITGETNPDKFNYDKFKKCLKDSELYNYAVESLRVFDYKNSDYSI